MRRAASLLLPIALAGCGHSPPTRFFTIDPAPPRRAVEAGQPRMIKLGRIDIPPSLDRPQLVTEVGGDRVKVDERDQWSAPLAELIRRALAEDLADRLPAGSIVSPTLPQSSGARVLTVDFLTLTAGPGGALSCHVLWRLLDWGSGKTLASGDVKLTANGAGGSGAQAHGLSSVLGELGTRIANSLGR